MPIREDVDHSGAEIDFDIGMELDAGTSSRLDAIPRSPPAGESPKRTSKLQQSAMNTM